MKTYFQGYADSVAGRDDFIGFTRAEYNMVGRNAPSALILNRIIYWHGTSAKTGKVRLQIKLDGKLWLAKTYDDWETECCVNASTARKAIDRLEKLGIIETRIGKFNNLNTLLIRIEPENFDKLYLSKMDTPPVQNGHLVPVQNGHFHIQEDTKEQEDLNTTTLPLQKSAVESASTSKTKTMPKPKSAKPETPPAIYVNLTNEKLTRPRPVDMSDDEYSQWLKQKPIWSLFAMWEVWNRTEGWHNRSVDFYQQHAVKTDWGKLCQQVQNMGRWLDMSALANELTITYELMSEWNSYYLETTFKDKPIQERKYPTTQEGFETNFGKFLTYRNTKGNHHE